MAEELKNGLSYTEADFVPAAGSGWAGKRSAGVYWM